MRLFKAKDYDEMSKIAANIIAAEVLLYPNCTLGLATGSTPIGTYKELIKKYEEEHLDFSNVKSINLDEYRGINKRNSQSYYYFMHKNLFDFINIKEENINIPNGMEKDAFKECVRYNNIIKDLGPINLQVLGIGHNGHIGFNEPDNDYEKETHVVELSKNTIEANSRFFDNYDDVPKEAYTVGIQTILQADIVMVLVSGKKKAQIVKDAFYGPVTPEVPASILQMHENFILVADEDALSKVDL